MVFTSNCCRTFSCGPTWVGVLLCFKILYPHIKSTLLWPKAKINSSLGHLMFHSGFLVLRVWLSKINTSLSEVQMKTLILRLTCMINCRRPRSKTQTHTAAILSPSLSLRTEKMSLDKVVSGKKVAVLSSAGFWVMRRCCEFCLLQHGFSPNYL